MTSQELGAKFEGVAKEFFVWLFEEIGFKVIKERVQFSGTQDGFDIQLIVVYNNFERQIYIECKNYSSDLDVGNILKKAWDLEKNYKLKEHDLFIAVSPKANFKNADNSEKSSPLLNEKFIFKSYLLDVSNGVKRMFALNEEFYKEIYGSVLDFTIDRDKQIEQFRNIIFSRKPFKKIHLSEKDKENYISNIKSDENYLTRTLTETLAERNELSLVYLLGNHNSKSLEEVIAEDNKIVLLGNPGLGKSTELKEFALSKWKSGEQDSFTPIFRNLRNFTSNSNIVDFLPENYNEIANCYFIFDGIDEIKDIQDFISKLELFVENNKSEINVYKYILSCRTNIYESVVKGINGFKVYYLRNLTNDDAFKLLKSKLDDCRILDGLVFQRIHYDFLKNPFLIGVLSEYINRSKGLPRNSIELWENYISKRLEFDKNEKLKKINLNTSLIKRYSKKISLICELMKSNTIEEDEIIQLITAKSEFDEYLKSPLIEKDTLSGKWYFEHRNIQEYLAAKYISEFSYSNIVDFISIKGDVKKRNKIVQFFFDLFKINQSDINKTHPSLFNTITFLINILNESKREQVISWLELSEPEILFTADSDRITSKTRQNVFQNYFRETCINNTFWISHNRSFTPEMIAKFGDCKENFDYLLSIIKNKKNHFRIIISALDLIENMTIPIEEGVKVKEFLFLKLKEKNLDKTKSAENDLKIKSNIITCIQKFKFCQDDSVYLNNIIGLFQKEDESELNHSLLYLVSSVNDIDDYFDYILSEFLRICAIKPRKKVDRLVSNRIAIEDIILRIKSPEKFLIILGYFLDDEKDYKLSLNFDSAFMKQVFEKCKEFTTQDKKFIENGVLEMMKKIKYWHIREKEIINLLNETDTKGIAIDKFLKNELVYDDCKFLIPRLVDVSNLSDVINKVIVDKELHDDVEFFRNRLYHNDKKTALIFEQKMLEKGFKFSEKLDTIEDVERLEIDRKARIQYNFDILFDKDQLSLEIKKIFTEIGKEVLDWDDMGKYQSTWYKKNNYFSKIDSPILVLNSLIIEKGSLNHEEVVSYLDEGFLMNERKKQFGKDNGDFSVSPTQEKIIRDWCLTSVERIDYDKVVLVKPDGNVSVSLEYQVCKNIYKFQQIFNFELPEEFYLKTLKYCDLESFSNEENQFTYIKEKIGDKRVFDLQIIHNLNAENLHSISLKNHIKYAIESNLKETFDQIKKMLLLDKSLYFQNENLSEFYNKVKDVDFLQECCNDIRSGLCWEAIKILQKENTEKIFLIEKAKKYLLTEEEDFSMNALGILFRFDQPEAISLYYDFLKEDKANSVKSEYYMNYSNEAGVKLIKDYYNILYDDSQNEDVFKHYYAKELYQVYLNNLSRKSDELFETTQKSLLDIKKKTKKELFYINMLIENSKTSYINLKSKALTFEEAKNKVIV